MSLSSKLEAFLSQAVEAKVAPGLIAEIFDAKQVRATAAAGVRDVESGEKMEVGTTAWMASMSKAVTSVCALVVAEKQDFDLDSPEQLVELFPEFKVGSGTWVSKIVDGKDEDGKFKYRNAVVGVTLRHLLAHTAGFGYEFSSEAMRDFTAPNGPSPPIMSCLFAAAEVPRDFEAGTGWLYGVSADWVAEYIIRATGKTLREAQAEYVLRPLGIGEDTLDSFRSRKMDANRTPVHVKIGEGAFILPPQAIDTLQCEGTPPAGHHVLGSASLHGTVAAYCIFLRSIMTRSPLLLSPKFWDIATEDALAHYRLSLPANPCFKSFAPQLCHDFPGNYMTPVDKEKGEGWTCLQTAVTRSDSTNGAKKGSLAWSGLANSYFWVDPVSGLGGCILAQFVAWGDPGMIKLKEDFERFVYENCGAAA